MEASETQRPVTPEAVRDARSVVLAGEIVEFRVALVPRSPVVADDTWHAELEEPEFLDLLLDAGTAAAKKGLGDGSSVSLAREGDVLLYRVRRYERVSSPFLSSAGFALEAKILKAVDELGKRVEKAVSIRLERPMAASVSWSPGPGLQITDQSRGIGTAAELEGLIAGRRLFLRRVRAIAWMAGFLALLIMVVAVALAFTARSSSSHGLSLVFGLYVAPIVGLGVIARGRARELEQEIQDLRDQQDLSDLIEEARERRAQKLFQVHSQQLKRYYDQALRQRGAIFLSGVACIIVGFTVVGAAFWIIQGSTDTTEKVVAAALGAVGGILGNFIAVIYLRMFTETVKSIGTFHDRLVITHHLHFANFLAAKVEDAVLRDRTLATLAEALALVDAAETSADANSASS